MKYELNSPVLELPEGYGKSILYVDTFSDIAWKQALAAMAVCFKKEFRYDYLQYDEFDQDLTCTGVLILEPARDLVETEHHFPSWVIAGGCFRRDESGRYFLDWIWFHPYARNRGNLKKRWRALREKFGDFYLTEPLSPHMELFMKSRSGLPSNVIPVSKASYIPPASSTIVKEADVELYDRDDAGEA